MFKYKIGDRVRIVDCKHGHHFDIGDIVTIQNKSYGDYSAMNNKGEHWYIADDEVEPINNKKIVITTEGTTTLARLYDNNKVIKTAIAKCSPEDEFDFNVGAELAFNRLLGKPCGKAAKEEWRVVNRKPKVGDYIRLKRKWYSFTEKGDILMVDDISSDDVVLVYGESHPRKTGDDHTPWSYSPTEYEVVEKVTKEEPKPKYYSGKVVCVTSRQKDFTVGKVYEIKDGKFTDNNGNTRPATEDRVTCEDDLTNDSYFKGWFYHFISLVEDCEV